MVQSMTAFAGISRQGSLGVFTWELKVINHRNFDCSMRMPEEFRSLEMKFRSLLQERLRRGRIEASLRLSPLSKESHEDLKVDFEELKKVAKLIKSIEAYLPVSLVDPIRLLSFPGVMQKNDPDTSVDDDCQLIISLFETVLEEVIDARKREGISLQKIITDRLAEIFDLVLLVKERIPIIISEQQRKIRKKITEITAEFDSTRLEQELVYFIQKIDVNEELNRLEIHLNEVQRILASEELVGKKLDFFMQELNREANTLASKSVDYLTTQKAVEIKVLVEEIREQVQNLM
jgi:TIGR00255 family protein